MQPEPVQIEFVGWKICRVGSDDLAGVIQDASRHGRKVAVVSGKMVRHCYAARAKRLANSFPLCIGLVTDLGPVIHG